MPGSSSLASKFPAHCLNLATLESKAASTYLGRIGLARSESTKASTAGTQRQTRELQGDESMNDTSYSIRQEW